MGTVKKSNAVRSAAWFFRNVRHACDGGRRGMMVPGVVDSRIIGQELEVDPVLTRPGRETIGEVH